MSEQISYRIFMMYYYYLCINVFVDRYIVRRLRIVRLNKAASAAQVKQNYNMHGRILPPASASASLQSGCRSCTLVFLPSIIAMIGELGTTSKTPVVVASLALLLTVTGLARTDILPTVGE